MSDYKIVNRVQQTPFLKAEMDAAGVKPADNLHEQNEHLIKNWQSYPEHAAITLKEPSKAVTSCIDGEVKTFIQTAQGQRTPLVGKLDLPDFEEPVPEPTPAQMISWDAEKAEQSEEDKEFSRVQAEDELAAYTAGQLGSSLPTDFGFVRKRDFEDFVVKVLAAFKHMGFDMRKF